MTNAVCGMANRMALEYSALVNAQLHLYPESISLTNLLVIHTDMLRVTDALRELCTETVDPVVRSMIQDEVAGVLPSSVYAALPFDALPSVQRPQCQHASRGVREC